MIDPKIREAMSRYAFEKAGKVDFKLQSLAVTFLGFGPYEAGDLYEFQEAIWDDFVAAVQEMNEHRLKRRAQAGLPTEHN